MTTPSASSEGSFEKTCLPVDEWLSRRLLGEGVTGPERELLVQEVREEFEATYRDVLDGLLDRARVRRSPAGRDLGAEAVAVSGDDREVRVADGGGLREGAVAAVIAPDAAVVAEAAAELGEEERGQRRVGGVVSGAPAVAEKGRWTSAAPQSFLDEPRDAVGTRSAVTGESSDTRGSSNDTRGLEAAPSYPELVPDEQAVTAAVPSTQLVGSDDTDVNGIAQDLLAPSDGLGPTSHTPSISVPLADSTVPSTATGSGLGAFRGGDPLGERALLALVDDIAGSREVQATTTPVDCLVLLEQLVTKLHPSTALEGEAAPLAPNGILAGVVLDDLSVGVHRPEQDLAHGPGWSRVFSWDTLTGAVRAAGPGSTALVLALRRGNAGHAYALYHTAEGDLRWLEPQAPAGRRLTDAPLHLGDITHLRALVVGPGGQVLPDALPWTSEANSTAQALIDAPTHHDYGALGFEVEWEYPIADQSGASLQYGDVLAVHSATGTRISVESRRSGNILEFNSSPARTLHGERRLPRNTVLDFLDHTRSLFNSALARSTRVRLDSLLRQRDGWSLTAFGQDIVVGRAPRGPDHSAYTQFTIGVPPDALLHILQLTNEFLPDSMPSAITFGTGREFGRKVAQRFAAKTLTDRQIRLQHVQMLAGTPWVSQVWAYSWLVFSHAGALPTYIRFFKDNLLLKNMVPAASRNPLGRILDALHPQVRNFFNTHYDAIVREFVRSVEDAVDQEEIRQRRAAGKGLGRVLHESFSEQTTLRDYLAYALRGATPGGRQVSQRETIGMNTEGYDNLDQVDGTPLILLELRQFHPVDFRSANLRSTFDLIASTVREPFDMMGRFPAAATPSAIRQAMAGVLDNPLLSAIAPFLAVAQHVPHPTTRALNAPGTLHLLSAKRSLLLRQSLSEAALGVIPHLPSHVREQLQEAFRAAAQLLRLRPPHLAAFHLEDPRQQAMANELQQTLTVAQSALHSYEAAAWGRPQQPVSTGGYDSRGRSPWPAHPVQTRGRSPWPTAPAQGRGRSQERGRSQIPAPAPYRTRDRSQPPAGTGSHGYQGQTPWPVSQAQWPVGPARQQRNQSQPPAGATNRVRNSSQPPAGAPNRSRNSSQPPGGRGWVQRLFGRRPAALEPFDTSALPGARQPTPATAIERPVPLEAWSHRRTSAPATLSTERFLPDLSSTVTPRTDLAGHTGLEFSAEGQTVLVRMGLQRVQADDGRWVRAITLRLPVHTGEGFVPDDISAFSDHVNDLFDQYLNNRYQLSRSGDQLHLNAQLYLDPDHPESIELTRTAAPEFSDQLHIRLHTGDPADPADLTPHFDDAVVLHELLHYTGLANHGLSPDSVFRHLAVQTDAYGIMTGNRDLSRNPVPQHYLDTIEEVTDSGPNLPEIPHPAQPAATTVTKSPNVVDTPDPAELSGGPQPLPGQASPLTDSSTRPENTRPGQSAPSSASNAVEPTTAAGPAQQATDPPAEQSVRAREQNAAPGRQAPDAAQHPATRTHLDLPFHNPDLKEQGQNRANVQADVTPAEPSPQPDALKELARLILRTDLDSARAQLETAGADLAAAQLRQANGTASNPCEVAVAEALFSVADQQYQNASNSLHAVGG